MAIKDQCCKCRNFGGEYCKHPSATCVFDQNSCIYYERSAIRLEKEDKEEYEARRRAALASDVAPCGSSPRQEQPAPSAPPALGRPTPAATPTYDNPVPVTPVDVTPAAPAQPAAPQPAAPSRSAAPSRPAAPTSVPSGAPTPGVNAPAGKLFENAFSFNGRIKRMEYALSLFLCYIGFSLVSVFDDFAIIITIAVYWFFLAQAAKRCHDVGHSAWWLLIPFYVFYLVFAEGDLSENEYGPVSLV